MGLLTYSSPFYLNVLPAVSNPWPVDSQGITVGGPGSDWMQTASPDFTQLEAIYNTINATTGGWALVPGTTLSTVQTTEANLTAASQSPPSAGRLSSNFLWRGDYANRGPELQLSAWCGAMFTGSGFVIGAGGGHYTWCGSDVYMIRLSGTPSVVRAQDVSGIKGVADGAGGSVDSSGLYSPTAFWFDPSLWPTLNGYGPFIVPQRGPFPHHHYNGRHWIPANKSYVQTGWLYKDSELIVGQLPITRKAIWEWTTQASDQTGAWIPHEIPTPDGGDPNQWGYSNQMIPLQNGNFYIDFCNRNGIQATGYEWNPTTKEFSVASLAMRSRFGRAMGDGWAPIDYRPSRNIYTWERFVSDAQIELYQIDPLTFSATLLYSPLPSYVGATAIYGATAGDDLSRPVLVGNKLVFTGPNREIGYYDFTSDTYVDWTPAGTVLVTATAELKSVYGGFGAITLPSGNTCFAAVKDWYNGVWLFRPPASWGI